MAAGADAGMLQVFAIKVGENLPNEPIADKDVQAHRRFGVIRVLRPAFDDLRRDPIDEAAQGAGSRRLIARHQSGAQGDAPPYRLDLIAFIKPWCAIPSAGNRHCVRIEGAILVRVVEHSAAVVVDEGFRRRALRDDHVVAIKLDVEIFDLLDALGLHDGDTVDEVFRLDQHAVQIHCMVR